MTGAINYTSYQQPRLIDFEVHTTRVTCDSKRVPVGWVSHAGERGRRWLFINASQQKSLHLHITGVSSSSVFCLRLMSPQAPSADRIWSLMKPCSMSAFPLFTEVDKHSEGSHDSLTQAEAKTAISFHHLFRLLAKGC